MCGSCANLFAININSTSSFKVFSTLDSMFLLFKKKLDNTNYF